MTLTYFTQFPLWKTFFTELGFEFVTSQPTNKLILNNGIKETVTDACIPIKLFHGHVIALKNKVDYIFIPRMVNIDKEKHITFCPKFLGLPDMIRASISNLPPILEVSLDKKNQGKLFLYKACRLLGRQLGKPYNKVFQAYLKAVRFQKKFEDFLVSKKITPVEAIDYFFRNKGNGIKKVINRGNSLKNDENDLNIAVVGYPYQIYDSYVSADIINFLRKRNVRVWTLEMIPSSLLKRYARRLPKKLFWHFSNKVVWASYHFIEQPFIDGIIHVSAFGCGPDAMVGKLVELECKERKFPFLNITIDEHTGEAGIVTRIEAFIDMLRYRRTA
ncbi:MAG: 2-hydroxyglutaryl-CoA dehydratase [Clostridia bacterium]|nr:2-hydroxyglutaryl-CoA dehydratase [Clostridia bacterium]